MTDGLGADAALEAVGIPATFELCTERTPAHTSAQVHCGHGRRQVLGLCVAVVVEETIAVEVSWMNAMIVVESSFGNTLAVARAVADGLGRYMTVDIREVQAAPPNIGEAVDLLVVGGPTQSFGMSKSGTRSTAARQAGHPTTVRTGVREWLESAPTGVLWAAAFDTKIDKRWVPGSAARAIAKRLRRLGAVLVLDPESFRVTATPGPLAAGELDRARGWGEHLGKAMALTGAVQGQH